MCTFDLSLCPADKDKTAKVVQGAAADEEEKSVATFADESTTDSVLSAIKAEVEQHCEDYCDGEKYADFLLSFQIQKLRCCFVRVCQKQAEKGDMQALGFHFKDGVYVKRV